MNSQPDANTRGWGLLLRVAGVIIPIVATCMMVAGGLQGGPRGPGLSAPLASFLKAAGILWGWPGNAYRLSPLGFGLMGLLAAAFVVALLLRRDRSGAVTVLVLSLFFGWFIAYLTTTD